MDYARLNSSLCLSLKMCFCFADVCARADTPGKTARATTSPAIRHRVKTEARAISSANMTTSASAPKVSTAQTFLLHIAPWNLTAPPRTSQSRERWNFFVSTRTIFSCISRFSLFSNLALHRVRITSSKVTGMTVESARPGDFRSVSPEYCDPIIRYSYVEVHTIRSRLSPSSVARFRST